MPYLSDNNNESTAFGGANENWIEYIIKKPLFKTELCNKKEEENTTKKIKNKSILL